jgi:type IV pilus assembly protein PilQ
MRWRIFALFVLKFSIQSDVLAATNVLNLTFDASLNPPEVLIEADGQLTYQKQENAADKQIILDISGAAIAPSAAQPLDASSLNTNVTMISGYQAQGQNEVVRVVIQLRTPATADVVPEGNNLKVKIGASPEKPEAASNSAATSENSPAPKTNLDEFTQSNESHKFTGKPITLQVREGDIHDVLRLIGDASGFNVVVGEDVRGKITLSLTDVPWDQALDVVLQSLHLGAERSNNILRVGTLANLTAEKTAVANAKMAAKAAEPRITRVFPVSYAKLSDLQNILTKFTVSTSSGFGGPTAETGVVQLDERTNSIVVRDTTENLDRIKKLIEILDTQTPQVMIEAKVIEATEGFQKSAAGSIGFGGQGIPSLFASFSGANPLDPLFGSPGVFANGAGVQTATAGSGSLGISPTVSFLPGVSRLNAILNLGESENQVKVISSPKTVVLNKESANIVEGTPVLIPGTTFQNGVPVPTTSIQNANVSLNVKPIVTNDGSILMDLTVSKDTVIALTGAGQSSSGVGPRNIKTTVLVDSGATLVIGGIYTMESDHTSGGFPILRDLPIIGALFGSTGDNTSRSELFIFITPRILNSRESGLSV